MPVIRVLVMLATMMMKLVKTAKEKKVFKNVGVSIMGITFWEAIKDSIKKQIKKSDWICGNVKTADDYLKTHPNSWLNSAIGVATITTMLMNVCFADDQSKKEVAETQKEAENARDRANKSGIELEQEKQKTEQEKQKTSNIETNNQIKVEQEQQKTEQEKQKTEQEKQKTSNIETNNQIKVEQEQQKTEQEKQKTSNIETNNQIKVEQEQQKTEQEKQKTNNTQKDLVKKAEQNCQENHSQFFIKKLGIKGGIAIEIEAECKTPKPAKTNQTPIQPKHLPNSKQPHSQRGSKVQELIAYLQKELESLPYSQKAIAKQVNFYKPSSIAYLELDPRDFKVTEEWQNENLKICSKAQAKMLEMRKTQANLSPSQSLLFVQKIFADVNKEIKIVANTEKKAEKAGYGYSKRV
ncbi:DUF874 family protein [Helicobacter pylori]|uniref:DUF874 family protein n=1 Tax=Helicobacter pylori TaxID=210 RepID=UPI00287B6DDE|nr:DUF874 family protein [Helicobacter pylori]WNE32725.1 DUF874 family protein [Helicobacter pylori]WNE34153.1 DUF874 family protein [Helicobacter pylori]WNE35579.1 DUF874 family protein [Helicobacter pylori]WNE37007.1 DUF874 family protein [Helicobacter pylori]WNE38432.1 DUF874 family protein [Helicobacter pylori]